MELNDFKTIQLSEMNAVKLMNRIDTKYWFHQSELWELLKSVEDNYLILDINNQTNFEYSTTYYDTINSQMYIAHQNGKLNRYKIRKRRYLASDLQFLEIKFKTNKGRTVKTRIKTTNYDTTLSTDELVFIAAHTPFGKTDLVPKLTNGFNRLTLVNKNFKERCTIDWNLNFNNNDTAKDLKNLAIVEVKSDGKSTGSAIVNALKQRKLRAAGFSKYCIGMAKLYPTLKQNNFKSKLLNVNRIAAI